MLLSVAEPEPPQPPFGVRDHNVIHSKFWTFDKAVHVVGAATQVESNTGVIAFPHRSTNPESDGYWFLEAGVAVDSSSTAMHSAGLTIGLTYRVSGQVAPEDWLHNSIEVVIRSRVMDLYAISSPIHLDIDGGLVTANHTIPFSTAASWRLSIQTKLVGGIERVRMNVHTDPVATSAEIREAASTAMSLRVSCDCPETADAVVLRGLSTEHVPC